MEKELTRQERREIRENGGYDRIRFDLKIGGYFGLRDYNDDGHTVYRYGYIGTADTCRRRYTITPPRVKGKG